MCIYPRDEQNTWGVGVCVIEYKTNVRKIKSHLLWYKQHPTDCMPLTNHNNWAYSAHIYSVCVHGLGRQCVETLALG